MKLRNYLPIQLHICLSWPVQCLLQTLHLRDMQYSNSFQHRHFLWSVFTSFSRLPVFFTTYWENRVSRNMPTLILRVLKIAFLQSCLGCDSYRLSRVPLASVTDQLKKKRQKFHQGVHAVCGNCSPVTVLVFSFYLMYCIYCICIQ